MRKAKTLFVWFFPIMVALSAAMFAQGTPPLHAELVDLPAYVEGGSLRVDLDPVLSSVPDGAWLQFRRISIAPSTGYDSTTIWLPSSERYFTFTGCHDSVKVGYQVRACLGADTSSWSSVKIVMHDLDNPHSMSGFTALWCASASHVMLVWDQVYDRASGIMEYRIYRRVGGSTMPLVYIDDSEFDLYYDIVHAGDLMRYTWIDDGVDPTYTYHYTIVAVDRVGHYNRRNPVVSQYAGGVDECIPMPPCAPLRSIDRYTQAENVNISINTAVCTPWYDWQYRFRMIDVTDSTDSIITTTGWSYATSVRFDLAECQRYIFQAQCTSSVSGLISSWTHSAGDINTIRDMTGPLCPDSIRAEPRDMGIFVQFWAEDPASLDCGSGFSHFNLYRMTAEDMSALPTLITNIATEGEPFRLRSYPASDSYFYFDDGSSDPVIDLVDRGNYIYFVFAVDSLGYFSSPVCMIFDTATVDKGVLPPMLASLPVWTPGTSVTLSIIDTTHCDITEIMLERSTSSTFEPRLTVATGFMAKEELDPLWEFTGCSGWDTLHFTFNLLDENLYCFRAISKDITGNVSVVSNMVCTNLDNSAPNRVRIESIKSSADSTDKVDITIVWSASTDARSGLAGYKLWRSNTAGTLGDLMATLPVFTHTWVDREPNTSGNWRDNYYTVTSYDILNFEETTGLHQLGFDAGTPPYTPAIDTVYIRRLGSVVRIRVEWTENTPDSYSGTRFFNRFRLEHSADPSWLYTGAPILIDIEDDVAISHLTELPHSALRGSPPRYFQLCAIDIWGNESGYSDVYTYVNESVEDSIWIHFTQGWNLFSLPIYPANPAVRHVLPDVAEVYEFNTETGAYSTPVNFEPGKGYWIRTATDMDVMLKGIPIENVIMRIPSRGWALVGGTFRSAGFSWAGTLLYGPSRYNTFSRTYTDISETTPGLGYWVLFGSDEATWITPGARKDIPYFAPSGSAATIYVDGTPFMLLENSGSESNLDEFDLPLPPYSPFEKATPSLLSSDGFRLLASSTSDGEWLLYLPEACGVSFNSSFNLAIDGYEAGNEANLFLGSGLYRISKSGIVISDRLGIESVSPNPFNSSTNISCFIPEKGDVTIEISDINGRMISFGDNLCRCRYYDVHVGCRRKIRRVYFCRISTSSALRNYSTSLYQVRQV
jgi:hypothetical protein